MIYTESWDIELNGQHELFENSIGISTKYDIKKSVRVQFRICLDISRIQVGQNWLTTSYNPGLHVRNRYGNNIYRHVEHWLNLGN